MTPWCPSCGKPLETILMEVVVQRRQLLFRFHWRDDHRAWTNDSCAGIPCLEARCRHCEAQLPLAELTITEHPTELDDNERWVDWIITPSATFLMEGLL